MIQSHHKFIFNMVFLLVIPIFFCACERQQIRSIEKLYQDGKFEEALKKTEGLLAKAPDSQILNYHAGIVFYKKGEYEKAMVHFTKSLTTENSALEARAVYNIGNTQYRKAEQYEKKDLAGAANLYQEALDYYSRAMELNEKDEDTKQNVGLAEKKLRDIQNRLEKHLSANKMGEIEKKKKGVDHFQKEPSSLGLSTLKEPDPLKGVYQKKERDGKAVDPLRRLRQTKGEPVEMSKEEAEMLLEGYRQEEESRTGYPGKKIRGSDPGIRKDW